MGGGGTHLWGPVDIRCRSFDTATTHESDECVISHMFPASPSDDIKRQVDEKISYKVEIEDKKKEMTKENTRKGSKNTKKNGKRKHIKQDFIN